MKKSDNSPSKFLVYLFIILIILPIVWYASVHIIRWPSAKSDLASFFAGILTDHQYGENPIIYGIGNISNYLYGSLILSFATILFLLIWIGADFVVVYLLIKEIWKKLCSLFKKDVRPPAKKSISKGKKKQTPERWTRKIWEKIKKYLLNLWLALCLLIVFIIPFFFLPFVWENVTTSWELARPNPENDYQIRTQTVKETDSIHHSGSGRYSRSYTEYFIEFNENSTNFQILNTGVLEKSYDALQEGQKVYTIVEIQPNGNERIFYVDYSYHNIKEVLENYLQQ